MKPGSALLVSVRANPRDARLRRGLTLAELLMSIMVVSMIMLAVATLSEAVRSSQDIVHQNQVSVQHARLALHRIRRHIESATANENFPGFVVFGDAVGGYTFPDILVVWHPEGTAADPTGWPRWNEIVVLGADTLDPRRLIEVTWPNDSQTVSPLTNTATWQQRLDRALRGESGEQVLLTDRLHTATISGRRNRGGTGGLATTFAAIRFDAALCPSAAQWNALLDGEISWPDLTWSHGVYSSTTGLRHHGCRIELQLREGDDVQTALPFFTSAVTYFEVSPP